MPLFIALFLLFGGIAAAQYIPPAGGGGGGGLADPGAPGIVVRTTLNTTTATANSATAVPYVNSSGTLVEDATALQYIAGSSAPPSAPVVTTHGTPGTTHYGYKCVFRFPTGTSAASAETLLTTGNAVLDSSNYNVITAPANAIPGCTVDVYISTAGGNITQTGYLANVNPGAAYNHQGLNGDNATPPLTDASAGAVLDGAIKATANGGVFSFVSESNSLAVGDETYAVQGLGDKGTHHVFTNLPGASGIDAYLLSFVDGDNYGFSEWNFGLINPNRGVANASYSTHEFGADGTLPNSGNPTDYRFFLYDVVSQQYVLELLPALCKINIPVQIGNLAGSGVRAVTADADGKLSAANPPSSGALVLLATVAASNSPIDILTRNQGGYTGDAFQTDFTRYLIVIEELLATTGGSSSMVTIRFSTDGSTFDSGSHYNWSFSFTSPLGSAGESASNDNSIRLAGSNVATDTAGASGQVQIYNPCGSTLNKLLNYQLAWFHDAGNVGCSAGGQAMYTVTTALKGFRLVDPTGNWVSGNASLYGIAK